jgi:hypothetical protein
VVPHRTYTAAEVDAAIKTLGEPERMAHAQEVLTHAAPALQRVLAEALHEGGWFAAAHDAEVSRVAAEPDPRERARGVDVLVAEQTRLGMFVGVTVGFQLAHELQRLRDDASSPTNADNTAEPPWGAEPIPTDTPTPTVPATEEP